MSNIETPALDVERAVKDRYASAAREREASLCCPVEYDARYLEAIPPEVLERDYGCGDPSRYVKPGDVVLDLGSGGGKICFIASQIAGASGRVIGVDMNDEMLDLARRAAPVVAESIGFSNTRFVRGHIQDLGLDVDRLDAWLDSHPVKNSDHIAALEAEMQRLRSDEPLVEDASVDIVVSNCVLNLVRPEDKQRLIEEIFRVLKRGGRIAISDIVSDEPVPAALRADPDLWSGCISGAFEECELLEALETAGFHGILIDKWEAEPFAVVEGIEFRSVTVTACKGKQGPCLEANQAVIYAGPWKQVEDDDGHVLRRGERTAVCRKTFAIYTREPYADHVTPVPPLSPVAGNEARDFDCRRNAVRLPEETKRGAARADSTPGAACDPDGGCC